MNHTQFQAIEKAETSELAQKQAEEGAKQRAESKAVISVFAKQSLSSFTVSLLMNFIHV